MAERKNRKEKKGQGWNEVNWTARRICGGWSSFFVCKYGRFTGKKVGEHQFNRFLT